LARGLVLVAAGAAEQRREPVLLDRVEQHRRLDAVAGAVGLLLDQAPGHGVGHRGDDQLHAELGDALVAELQHVGEVQPGVDVHDREGDAGRRERLAGQLQHHDRVLAAGEEQHRALELRGHLADDVDGLGLQRLQLGEPVVRGAHALVLRGIGGRARTSSNRTGPGRIPGVQSPPSP
jgi:hypothetical protein